jgi:hypothetical protein
MAPALKASRYESWRWFSERRSSYAAMCGSVMVQGHEAIWCDVKKKVNL